MLIMLLYLTWFFAIYINEKGNAPAPLIIAAAAMLAGSVAGP